MRLLIAFLIFQLSSSYVWAFTVRLGDEESQFEIFITKDDKENLILLTDMATLEVKRVPTENFFTLLGRKAGIPGYKIHQEGLKKLLEDITFYENELKSGDLNANEISRTKSKLVQLNRYLPWVKKLEKLNQNIEKKEVISIRSNRDDFFMLSAFLERQGHICRADCKCKVETTESYTVTLPGTGIEKKQSRQLGQIPLSRLRPLLIFPVRQQLSRPIPSV